MQQTERAIQFAAISLLTIGLLQPIRISAQQVRDSAGAHIIKYAAKERAAARWTVETKPVVKIGGANGQGPTEFAQILGVARLSDGLVVIAYGRSTRSSFAAEQRSAILHTHSRV